MSILTQLPSFVQTGNMRIKCNDFIFSFTIFFDFCPGRTDVIQMLRRRKICTKMYLRSQNNSAPHFGVNILETSQSLLLLGNVSQIKGFNNF